MCELGQHLKQPLFHNSHIHRKYELFQDRISRRKTVNVDRRFQQLLDVCGPRRTPYFICLFPLL